MIDIRELRQNPDPYKKSATLRGFDTAIIDQTLVADASYRQLLPKVEAMRSELNVKGKPTAAELTVLQGKKAKLDQAQTELRELETSFLDLCKQIPNLMADGTPEGGEDASREERHWGEPVETDFEAKDHLAIAESRDWLDFERGAKVAGAKFYYLKGAAVRLEMAVMKLAMDRLEGAGFTLMSVPHLVSTRIAEGAGFLPRGEEPQIYRVEDQDLSLIATAEIPLTGYHADEILKHDSLQYAALSPSYRLEAGAYGKHSRGLYRVHQFDKLEMYVYSPPEESEAWLEKIVRLEEDICQALEIPYRVVRIATGDMGAPHYKKYDLEYWSPVDRAYREITSASNCTDYQARRLNIRMRDAEGKIGVAHTLNGTAIAFSRVFIALLENQQQADGSIRVPEALVPYYGGNVL